MQFHLVREPITVAENDNPRLTIEPSYHSPRTSIQRIIGSLDRELLASLDLEWLTLNRDVVSLVDAVDAGSQQEVRCLPGSFPLATSALALLASTHVVSPCRNGNRSTGHARVALLHRNGSRHVLPHRPASGSRDLVSLRS